MYDIEYLTSVPFLKIEDNINSFDSLTNVLTKQTIVSYSKALINNKIPFELMILDLDDFKQINDNYGHQIGDQVLTVIGNSLIEYMGDKGLVGRFGGDEFLLIFTKSIKYDDVNEFLKKMYSNLGVLNKFYVVDDLNLYITGTIGTSAYPKDSDNFLELFFKADKALYYSKNRGRNCYSIFLSEIHNNIDISNKKNNNTILQITSISKELETNKNLDERIMGVLDYITISNQFFYSMYIDEFNNCMTNEINVGKTDVPLEELEIVLDGKRVNDIIDLKLIKDIAPILYKTLNSYNILSFLISKVYYKKYLYGYILFTENKTERVWQDDNKALISYLSNVLALIKYYKK